MNATIRPKKFVTQFLPERDGAPVIQIGCFEGAYCNGDYATLEFRDTRELQALRDEIDRALVSVRRMNEEATRMVANGGRS